MDAKILAATKHFTFPSLPSSFMYDPISKNEVYPQILLLNPLKAAGPENVPIKFLKILTPVISTYLRDAFNKCYETGIFPNPLKNTKIFPIYKAKQKDIASNYRPTSLLSPISKIFEKLLYSRLELFFSKNKVITKQQFGFRCGYSTEMAVKVRLDWTRGNAKRRDATKI